MKIGFVGLGKLGMPCAVALAQKGHDVLGFDLDPRYMNKSPRQYKETGPDGKSDFNDHLAKSNLRFGSLREVASKSDVIFVAVQTPHDPKFEGITRLTGERKDFNYLFLEHSIRELAKLIKKDTIVVVISTVLPGTMRERIIPLLNSHMKLCYNPFFIAMGTTMHDFLNPEFILCGSEHPGALKTLEEVYSSLTDAQVFKTSIENAELIKVAYNTFIGMKIGFVNTLMEICHKTPGTDVDQVTEALCLSTKRLISSKYLTAGMGDGGGCHPRDNIALSWLSQKLKLSYDWFENVMKAREMQTEWLADLMCQYSLPKAILGFSFKPESNITTGSPALLLKSILEERGEKVIMIDPVVAEESVEVVLISPMVFLIGTKHEMFKNFHFPKGSIVIDPWRYLKITQSDITYVPVGKGQKPLKKKSKKVSQSRASAAL